MSATAAPPAAEREQPAAPPETAVPTPAPKKPRPRRRRRHAVPSWMMSGLIHAAFLGALLSVSTAVVEVRKPPDIDSSLSTPPAEPEMLAIAAQPVDTSSRELGSAPASPSATPSVQPLRTIDARASMPDLAPSSLESPIATLPAAPTRDLSTGGMVSGDVVAPVTGYDQAIDQLAREILRRLRLGKLTVVWLFDESGSMKDDQQAIAKQLDRVDADLSEQIGPAGRADGALWHAVIGFGSGLHIETRTPTADFATIRRAIDHLRIDPTGAENTMQALVRVGQLFGEGLPADRSLMVVLVTDESGDDGLAVEEARQALVARKIALYVLGRQALFGHDVAHLVYVDPVTKDTYWPAIRRGPETAGLEVLQFDGLHPRREEQPSGFGCYELARLVKETGGIYFILPSEEGMRVRQREQAYSMTYLKEYVPDYEPRAAYVARREGSPLRKALFEIIQGTAAENLRQDFPVEPAELVKALGEARADAVQHMTGLTAIEATLAKLRPQRDRETEKRWQAAYDLMHAQIKAYQVKTYEYGACVEKLLAERPKPKTQPSKDVSVWWHVDHSDGRFAPAERTDKERAEAIRRLDAVIAAHPTTPWADLAAETKARGLGVHYHEASAKREDQRRYAERVKFVPKY